MNQGFVYILRSSKTNKYYVGSTIDVWKRFEEHCLGRVKSTKSLLPLELLFSQQYCSIAEARSIEYWIKRQKSRALLERIIEDGTINKKARE